jgi:hypothetical protein
MPKQPDIEQTIVLHLDSDTFTSELDAALRQLEGGINATLSRMSASAAQPGGTLPSLDFTQIFQSLKTFATALDDLSAKLTALSAHLGTSASGDERRLPSAVPSPSPLPYSSPSPIPQTAPLPAAAQPQASGSTLEQVYYDLLAQSSLYNYTQQLSIYGITGAGGHEMRRIDALVNSAMETIRQLSVSGTSMDAPKLEQALSTLSDAMPKMNEFLDRLQSQLALQSPSLEQVTSKVQAGEKLTDDEVKQLQAFLQTMTAYLYRTNFQQEITQSLQAGQDITLPNAYNTRLLSLFGWGALGYMAGSQISSGLSGALSPLEPLMGGNILNATQVAIQGAPIFNAAVQGQTLPLSFSSMQNLVTSQSNVTGMPMFQTLETMTAAQLSSGIAGGMLFFRNAQDLYQFSQALGIAAPLAAQVAGQAQVGGVSNFNGYFASLVGLNQTTGLTNQALFSALAQLQSGLIGAGISPAGAEMPLGTFVTAAHMAGVNGTLATSLMNVVSQGMMGAPTNPFAATAQLGAEQTWLKVPGVAAALGFPVNNSLGQGLAMGIFQNTPLGQGQLGEAKLLSESSILAPLAQAALNPHLSEAERTQAALRFSFATSLPLGPQLTEFMHILGNPGTAHYLSGALSAEMTGGQGGLQRYLGDVNNSHTRNLLHSFLSNFQGSPEYNVQHLTANVQSAKFSLGASELGTESAASNVPLLDIIGGFGANIGLSALPLFFGSMLGSMLSGTSLLTTIPGKLGGLLKFGRSASGAANIGAAAAGEAEGAATGTGEALTNEGASALLDSVPFLTRVLPAVTPVIDKLPYIGAAAIALQTALGVGGALGTKHEGRNIGAALGGGAGTLGGMFGGAELGAATGTAIFPGVGTVIGGLLGGAVGAFAGSGIGHALGADIGSLFDPSKRTGSAISQTASSQIGTLDIQTLKIDNLVVPPGSVQVGSGTVVLSSGGTIIPTVLEGAGGASPPTTGNPISNFVGNVINSIVGSPTIPNTVLNSPALDAVAKSYPELSRWLGIIQKAHEKYPTVPIPLIAATILHESSGDASALSATGAMGLMQLEPSTARGLGVKNPWNPTQNILGGTHLLALDLQQFHGNVEDALAAYYAGAGAVQAHGAAPYSGYWQVSIADALRIAEIMANAQTTEHKEEARHREVVQELKKTRRHVATLVKKNASPFAAPGTWSPHHRHAS